MTLQCFFLLTAKKGNTESSHHVFMHLTSWENDQWEFGSPFCLNWREDPKSGKEILTFILSFQLWNFKRKKIFFALKLQKQTVRSNVKIPWVMKYGPHWTEQAVDQVASLDVNYKVSLGFIGTAGFAAPWEGLITEGVSLLPLASLSRGIAPEWVLFQNSSLPMP